MSSFIICRLIGMLVFAFIGSRIGTSVAHLTEFTEEQTTLIFLGLGALTGLIATPWITILPVRYWRRAVSEMTIPRLMLAVLGGLVGLTVALMLAFPLSLLDEPVGRVAPAIVSVLFGYLGMNIFSLRSREILDVINERVFGRQRRLQPFAARQLLLDTSVLIDGRIVEIAETGFIGGTLVIPRFVLSELHRVADSSDSLRRNRGRRGLAKLNELQRNNDLPVKIVDDDPQDFGEVDAKLVALSIQLNASLVTNDFNLNQVADAQGVGVLNINALSNAVRSVYIPGEKFTIRIIQTGRDPNQGIGYLDDGTMVVVESGQKYMDRNVDVESDQADQPANRTHDLRCAESQVETVAGRFNAFPIPDGHPDLPPVLWTQNTLRYPAKYPQKTKVCRYSMYSGRGGGGYCRQNGWGQAGRRKDHGCRKRMKAI